MDGLRFLFRRHTHFGNGWKPDGLIRGRVTGKDLPEAVTRPWKALRSIITRKPVTITCLSPLAPWRRTAATISGLPVRKIPTVPIMTRREMICARLQEEQFNHTAPELSVIFALLNQKLVIFLPGTTRFITIRRPARAISFSIPVFRERERRITCGFTRY